MVETIEKNGTSPEAHFQEWDHVSDAFLESLWKDRGDMGFTTEKAFDFKYASMFRRTPAALLNRRIALGLTDAKEKSAAPLKPGKKKAATKQWTHWTSREREDLRRAWESRTVTAGVFDQMYAALTGRSRGGVKQQRNELRLIDSESPFHHAPWTAQEDRKLFDEYFRFGRLPETFTLPGRTAGACSGRLSRLRQAGNFPAKYESQEPIIERLATAGIDVEVCGPQLVLSAPIGAITPALHEEVTTKKQEILEDLRLIQVLNQLTRIEAQVSKLVAIWEG